jgi:hypothetical protein
MTKLRIFIPSKGRANVLTTPQLLEQYGIDYTIVLHNDQEKQDYLKNKTLNHKKILVANVPIGMPQIMHFINTQIKKDEWILKLDDNIRSFTAVDDAHYKMATAPADRKIFNGEITPIKFLQLVEDTIKEADKRGAKFIGFAVTDNPMFRSKKYRDVGYALGKMVCIKGSDLQFDLGLQTRDDFEFTCQHLLRYGRVLINNFIKANAGHYEQGGCGTFDQRLPQRIADCVYLMNKYPMLLRYKTQKECPPKSDIQLRFTNTVQVKQWQKEMAMNKNKLKMEQIKLNNEQGKTKKRTK